MTLDKPECDKCCAGAAPYFMCRNKACVCHLVKHLNAIRTPIRLTHADHTANQAVGNVMKGTKR